MPRPKAILATLTLAGITVGIIGAPATAAPAPPKAELAIVHGVPGVRFDVCIDGTEVKSRLRYGKVYQTLLEAGDHRIVLKPARKGTCKGRAVMKHERAFTAFEDLTLVASFKKGVPGFLVFDNDLVPAATSPAAPQSAIVVQHGARFGPVDVFAALLIEPAAASPLFAGLTKGRQAGTYTEIATFAIWVARPGKVKPLAGPDARETMLGQRNHYVFIGTNARNRRIAFFRSSMFVL